MSAKVRNMFLVSCSLYFIISMSLLLNERINKPKHENPATPAAVKVVMMTKERKFERNYDSYEDAGTPEDDFLKLSRGPNARDRSMGKIKKLASVHGGIKSSSSTIENKTTTRIKMTSNICSNKTTAISISEDIETSKEVDAKQEEGKLFKVSNSVSKTVKKLTQCSDKNLFPSVSQRGNYFVMNNYIKSEMSFACADAVTLTTHSDYSYLDNIIPLVEQWRGPISLTLYAPGKDFENSLNCVLYLRKCKTPLIRQLVNFHFYFDADHLPEKVPSHEEVLSRTVNCSEREPYLNVNVSTMYKSEKKLVYPVNVARNVARHNSQTYYLLPSDIELYPSPNISKRFLNMLAREDEQIKERRVYPVHIYEIKKDAQMPMNKTRLREMLKTGDAIPFHKKVCPTCHGIPMTQEWLNVNDSDTMHVLTVAQRKKQFGSWEPIYIGTDQEPPYDERLSWDGKSDKIVQSFILCTLNYEFAILDSGFLVHRPGIKTYTMTAERSKHVVKTNSMKNVIKEEVKSLYGDISECHL